eukprot:364631-Chlamydomonas_euryale.AAC.24
MARHTTGWAAARCTSPHCRASAQPPGPAQASVQASAWVLATASARASATALALSVASWVSYSTDCCTPTAQRA